MKRVLFFISFLCLILAEVKSQTEYYFQEMTSEDYENLKLPPLSTLYENALSSPRVQQVEQEVRIAELLVRKERRAWLSFFTIRAGYSYGKTDNFGKLTDWNTEYLIREYTGTNQHFFNVGATLSVPLDDLFDLGGRIKRQKAEAEKSRQEKLFAYDELKEQIASAYVTVISHLATLKVANDNVIIAEGHYKLMEEMFKNRRVELADVSQAKYKHFDYAKSYEEIRIQLNSSLLRLEILSKTPIISK